MYTLKEIAKATNAKIYGDQDISIDHLIYDSRKMSKAHSSLFIALTTDTGDGHRYLSQMDQAGIAAVLVLQHQPAIKAAQLVVSDTLQALHSLAAYHRQRLNPLVIGVTGSNGKTIVKEWLHSILLNEFSSIRSPRSYNSQLGVALSLWAIREHHNVAVIEAGISKAGEMDRLWTMIQPNIGVFTHFGDAHDEGFDSRAHKLSEKLKLFKNCDFVVHKDDSELTEAFRKAKIKSYSWGDSESASLRVLEIKTQNLKTEIILRDNREEFNVSIPFLDRASIENALHCIAAARMLKIPLESLQHGLSNLEPIDMRLQHVEGINGNTLILDHYNSDLHSLKVALDLLSQQAGKRKKMVILSDIAQTGLPADALCKQLNTLLQEHKIDLLFGVGPVLSDNGDLLEVDKQLFENTEELKRSISPYEIEDAVILIKGARKFQFEQISELFLRKVHQTQLSVNMSRLQDNLNYFKSKIPPNCKMMAMVKAYSYGTGGHQIAKLLEYNKVDYLAVAYLDEGVRLREAGIATNIMVLNSDLSKFNTMVEYGLQPVIYSVQMLNELVRLSGGQSHAVHLEFDTGMHRLGFESSDIQDLLQTFKSNPQLKIESVFSHLASADIPDQDDYTRQQIDAFVHICQKMESGLGRTLIKHIANTSGIERFPEASLNMVRLGIGLYGIHPIDVQPLVKPVGEFSSYIAQIRAVRAGEGIGYGQHDSSNKDRKIAVVAVGYADGFNRAFSRGLGYFMINGQSAPVVGNVCMDMSMCDVTDIECKAGDKAVIFGDQPPVEELAIKLNTIAYEVLSSVGERVNRIYYQEQ